VPLLPPLLQHPFSYALGPRACNDQPALHLGVPLHQILLLIPDQWAHPRVSRVILCRSEAARTCTYAHSWSPKRHWVATADCGT
jgi:hypothetical protein